MTLDSAPVVSPASNSTSTPELLPVPTASWLLWKSAAAFYRTPTFFDRSGRPISTEQVQELRGDPVYMHVATTKILLHGEGTSQPLYVDTFWSGLDVASDWLNEPHIPLIFRTAVWVANSRFGDSLSPAGGRWYSCVADASAGHDEIVEQLRDQFPDAICVYGRLNDLILR